LCPKQLINDNKNDSLIHQSNGDMMVPTQICDIHPHSLIAKKQMNDCKVGAQDSRFTNSSAKKWSHDYHPRLTTTLLNILTVPSNSTVHSSLTNNHYTQHHPNPHNQQKKLKINKTTATKSN
jgi:hypothetical protein